MNTIGYKILTLIILSVVSVNILSAKVYRTPKAQVSPLHAVMVDSIDYRKDLTRVYMKIVGKPHTSMRIDAIDGMTDIDGIDIKRWFQFEDMGLIPVELDFKLVKKGSNLNFIIHSTHGDINCNIPYPKQKKKK